MLKRSLALRYQTKVELKTQGVLRFKRKEDGKVSLYTTKAFELWRMKETGFFSW